MKFKFIWVGKTRDKNWLALQNDYLERLSHFAKCDICEIRDANGAAARKTEGNRILDKVNQNAFACLLDIGGKSLSSNDLAAQLGRWQDSGLKEIVFIIGGATGVSAEVAARADFRVSLSFLTFTHEMARVVLIEQLYRAFTIIKGFPYQK